MGDKATSSSYRTHGSGPSRHSGSYRSHGSDDRGFGRSLNHHEKFATKPYDKPSSYNHSYSTHDSRGYGSGSSYYGRSEAGSGLRDVDWRGLDLPKFEKNFYVEHSDVKALSESEVEKIRREKEITIVSGKDVPKPVVKFEYTSFPKYILSSIEQAGFQEPTPIQVQAWPIILSGRDMIGIAETAIVHINAQPLLKPGDGPIVLVLAPTRELAEQIREAAESFGRSSKLKTSVAYGGVPRRAQVLALRRGVEVLVACPGRLLDLLESGATDLRRVTFLVLDEADRMLDMGFEPQIRRIVGQVRPDRQTAMFSATWPREVQALAQALLARDCAHVNVGSLALAACHNVDQTVFVLEEREKPLRLRALLRSLAKDAKVLIFSETKRGADALTRELRLDGWPALCIHGDKRQDERAWVLAEFKSGKHPIMIATDVASRGLDVRDVRFVINYDFPSQLEDYVHRIGRTGRAGMKGSSYTFLTPEKFRVARDLVKLLKEANQTVPPELLKLANERSYGQENRRWGAYGRSFSNSSNAVPIGGSKGSSSYNFNTFNSYRR